MLFKGGNKEEPIELDIRKDLLKVSKTKGAVERLEKFVNMNH